MIVGMTGRARSGKDTAGAYLVKNYNFVRGSFAQPLKDMLLAIGVDVNNDATKEVPHPVFGVSPRVMAQTLGTDWMRDMIHRDGWVLLLEQFLLERLRNNQDAVVTDVRFENEATLIRNMGGRIWHIERPDVMDIAAHKSEAGIAFVEGDCRLINDASHAHFGLKIDMELVHSYV